MDGDEVAAHNRDIVVVDCKDESCVDRGIDQSQQVFLALFMIHHG